MTDDKPRRNPGEPPPREARWWNLRGAHLPRRVRFAMAAALLAILLAIGVGLGYRRLTSPERIRAMVEGYLQQYTNGRVRVGSASWSFTDGVQLRDVVVMPSAHSANEKIDPLSHSAAEPSTSATELKPVFVCKRVRLTTDHGWRFFRRPRIEAILATEPTCRIVRDTSTGGTNLSGLLRLPEKTRPSMASDLTAGPTIELRDARVKVLIRQSGRDRLVEDLRLTVRARPSPTAEAVYDVVWSDQSMRASMQDARSVLARDDDELDGRDAQAAGSGQVDLRTGAVRNVRGGLPWMSIEAVMAALNTRYDAAGAWCDLLGLEGTVRVSDYHFEPGDSGAGTLTTDAVPATSEATIELSNASVSIPVNAEEYALNPTQRYLRFDDVDGRAVLTRSDIRAEFAARFQGHECRVSAVLHDGLARPTTLANAAFDARISVKALDLPRLGMDSSGGEARFIRRWRSLMRFYRDFDPSGTADLELDVTKRAGEGQPVKVRRALVTALDASATCRRFPYRLERLRGPVEFTPDRVTIRGVTGGTAEGGRVHIEGWVDRPNGGGAKKLTISARGVPFDQQLLAALPARYARAIEPFAPSGRFDARVVLSHDAAGEQGQGSQRPELGPRREPVDRSVKAGAAQSSWRTQAEIVLRDISAEYARFPYPVDHITGELSLDGDRLTMTDLAGRAGTAQVQLEGGVAWSDHGIASLDVSLRAQDVPIDDALLSALSPEWRASLRPFHARGRFNVDTAWKMTGKENVDHGTRDSSLLVSAGSIDQETCIGLEGVSFRHERFPIEVNGVTGTLRLAPGHIVVEGVTGEHRGGVISIEGSQSYADVQPGGSGRPDSAREPGQFTVRTRNLALDEETRAALPGDLQAALADWSVDGPVRTETVIRTDAADLLSAGASTGARHERMSADVHTAIHFDGARVGHAGLPAPFAQVSGKMVLDADGFRGENLHARYGPAVLRADLLGRRTAKGWVDEGNIVIRATHVPLDDKLGAILPPALARTWERIQPTGSANVHIDALGFRRAVPSAPRTWTIGGYVEFDDIASRRWRDGSRFSGTVLGSGMLKDREGGAMLKGTLTAASLDILSQPLRRAEAVWSFVRTAEGDGVLDLRSVNGQLHGGELKGEAEIGFDARQTQWRVQTTVHGMRIGPFVTDGQSDTAGSRPAEATLSEPSGRANGHLYLSGVVGDPSRRRGGGRFEIEDGRLYRLPLIAAILHVLNLSIPDEGILDDAQAGFFIIGNRVELKHIVLRGGALSLVGSGSLTIPDRGLDLSLINVSPQRWARLPVIAELVEGASRELVELEVTGPLSSPAVHARPLRGISDELSRLFQKKKAKTTVEGEVPVRSAVSQPVSESQRRPAFPRN